MKVILLSELPGKGGEGDVIDVADGFANNYLLPQGIALKATAGNLKQLEQRRANIAKREVTRLADAASLKEQLDGKCVRVEATVGDEGQLFGSVTGTQIAAAIQEQLGFEIDRKRVVLNTPIKMVGNHSVVISLYRETAATIEVQVNDAAGFAALDAAAAQAAVVEVAQEAAEEEVVEEA